MEEVSHRREQQRQDDVRGHVLHVHAWSVSQPAGGGTGDPTTDLVSNLWDYNRVKQVT